MSMVLDFVLCWAIERICKVLFADLEPVEFVTRGRERREKRRAQEAQRLKEDERLRLLAEGEKKAQ